MLTTGAVLQHTKVSGTSYRGDCVGMANLFVTAFKDTTRQFPIGLHDVWEPIGFVTLADALSWLHGGLFRDAINFKTDQSTGTIAMTFSTFQVLAMCSQKREGADLREFFLACRHAFCDIASCYSVTEKLLAMHHMSGCLYVAVIQESPERICKFGQTHDVQRRYLEHQRTFTTPYCFELLHVVGADDPRKAEEIFRCLPEVKDHSTRVTIGENTFREVLMMPATFTLERLRWCMESAAIGSGSRDESDAMCLKSLLSQKAFEHVLASSIRLQQAQLEHDYRMAQLELLSLRPLSVSVARILNRPEQDQLQAFLERRCRMQSDVRTLQTDMLQAFRTFCRQEVSAEEFARQMALKGFLRKKDNNQPRRFYYEGVCLQ